MVEFFLRRTPLLRPLMAFVAGIVLSNSSSPDYAVYYLSFALLMLLIAAVIVRWGSLGLNTTSGVLLLFMFAALGAYRQADYRNHQENTQVGGYWTTLLERPTPTARSYRAEALIIAQQQGVERFAMKEKILVYFAATVEADTLLPGDKLFFTENPRPINNGTNPHAFDFSGLMQRRNIYRQVYLNADAYTHIGKDSTNRIRVEAERMRERLLAVYAQSGLEGDALAILSALSLGQKKLLEPEVRQTFAAAGATHILAVSGLHVGILFMAFNLTFAPLRRSKKGRYVFMFLAILVLWLYALVTGLSPSVQRASLMFSLLQIGISLRRPVNVYNTLAGSALLLLLVQPLLLYEVGFQLSYAAVTSIVYFQPRIVSLIKVRNKVLKYIWELSAVSVAAQLGTFAIAGFYFNQFPVWFLLTNLVVIPAALVFILLGIAILATSWLPFIAEILAAVTAKLLHVMHGILQWIEALPSALYSGFLLDRFMLMGIIVGILLGVLVLETRRMVYIRLLLFTGIVFYGYSAVNKWLTCHSSGMVVYDYRQPVLHLFAGRINYVVAPASVVENDRPLLMVDRVVQSKGFRKPQWISFEDDFSDRYLSKVGERLYFVGRSILLPGQNNGVSEEEYFDYAIETRGFGRNRRVGQHIVYGFVGYSAFQDTIHSNQHSIRNNGAFYQNFSPFEDARAWWKFW